MQQQASITYQCINAACGHTMPRAVKFCPWCGTPQQAGAAHPARPASVGVAVPAPAVVAAPGAQSVPAAGAAAAAAPIAPTPAHAPPPPAHVAPTPAAPPQRQPLHWGWWLIGVGMLWLAWVAARPASHKLDARIDAAVDMAQACKGKQAQSELIALRAGRASPAQLQRLQKALNEAASACERTRLRDKAWVDASNAIDTALASASTSASTERARARLAAFTRRWGEDAATTAAKARIDAAKRDQAPPAAAPPRNAGGESASNLMAEAERDISRGNYKGAIDKMDTCVAMVDAGNRDCMALKAKAQRLYQGL